MPSNKLSVVLTCTVIIAVIGLVATSTMSDRDNVTKRNVSATDPVARSAMALIEPVSSMAVTELVVGSTVGGKQPATRSTMSAVSTESMTDRTSHMSLTDAPDTTSTLSLTDPPDRTSTVSLTDAPDRTSTVSPSDAPGRTSTVSPTDAPDRTSTVSPSDAPDRTSTVSPTDAPDRTSTVSPSDAPDRTSTVSLTDAPDRTSTVSFTDAQNRTSTVSPSEAQNRTSTVSPSDAPDTRSTVSPTNAPDRTSTVSPTDAPDRKSTVSPSDAPDRRSTVSPSDAPDTTSTLSLTDAQDRTSTVSPSDAPDRTSTVSPSEAQNRTSTVSLSDAPDRTSTVSPSDAPDRTSTVSPSDAPDRTSTVSPSDAPDRTSTVSLTDAPDRTSTVSPTDAPDRTSTVSPSDAPDRTSTVSPSDAQNRTSTVSLTDAPDRATSVSSTHAPDRTSTVLFTTDHERRTFLLKTKFRKMWVNKKVISTGKFVPRRGGNSLDRVLSIQVQHGDGCPFGQVYYDESCHVTWKNTTPPPLPSNQDHMSAPSNKPRSATSPHMQLRPTGRKHVQLLTCKDVQPSATVPVNSPSTTGDFISSPSTPTRENDAMPINGHAPTPSLTTHNYTGGHSKNYITGTNEDNDSSASAVTTSTNKSHGHVLNKADTRPKTSRLQCTHIILDNSTFNMYLNGSVVLKGGKVINDNDFILTPKGHLKVCVSALGPQGANTNGKYKIDHKRPTVVLTNICLVSSQMFLLLTFILHCFFSSLRNLPGMILMFLSVSLFLAHASFFGSDEANNRTTCIAIGVVIHFFWLASFCWLNISSFHTFRVFKDIFASRSFESNKKRIIFIYSAFGYGTPAIVVTAMITANYFVSGSESFGYADTSNFCFVSSGTNSIVGLLVPAGITILISFTLFILTVVYLCKASANRRKVGNGEKWNILMYIKLSSITGFSWVFGFLQMVDRNSQVFTYLFIFLTGAQGVFIFMAFMANKRTFLLVKHACRKQNNNGKYSTKSSDIDTKCHVTSEVEDADKV